MSTCSTWRYGLVGVVWLAATLAALTAGAQSVKPRYGFTKGQVYGYDLKITWTYPDHTETKKGFSLYKVISARKDRLGLSCVGHLAKERPPRAAAKSAQPDRIHPTRATLMIDRRGELLNPDESLTSLAEVMEFQETIALPRLPEGDEKHWYTLEDISIGRNWASMPSSVVHGRIPAQQRVDYRFERAEGHLAWISRTHRVKTTLGLGFQFDMTGKGRLAFDARRGLVTSFSSTYTISTDDGAKKETTSAKVDCRLLDPTKVAALVEMLRPKRPNPAARKLALRGLRSRNLEQIGAGIALAGSFARDDRPDDFAKPLAKLLKHPVVQVRLGAAMALGIWATPAAETELIDALQKAGPFAKPIFLKALAAVGTENAARAIALEAQEYPLEVCGALMAMGPAAEKPAVELLRSSSHQAQEGACRILARIGGASSAVALQRLPQSAGSTARIEAHKALVAIRKRVSDEEIAEAARRQEAGRESMHSWTDTTGKFKIKARLLGIQGASVVLKKEDGKRITVPLEKLSKADQLFVRSRMPSQ